MNNGILKIILIAPVHYGSKGQWYLKSLCNLGHKVMLINESNYFKETGKSLFRKAVARYSILTQNNFFNDDIYTSVMSFMPDLIIVLKGLRVKVEKLLDIKKNLDSVKIFNINYDDFFSRYKSNMNKDLYECVRIYDCVFTTRRVNVTELIDIGARRAEYIPFCYDQTFLYPVIPSASEYEIYKSDIALIASFEEERANTLERISGLDLAIWGNGWHKLKKNSHLHKHVRHKDVYEIDFSKVVNSSKIALNFFRKGNRDQLNSRAFELPACGAFVISERSDELANFFEEDKEVICFSDDDELQDKVNYYLKHEDERKKIAITAYEKLKSERYSVQDRVIDILSVFEEFQR